MVSMNWTYLKHSLDPQTSRHKLVCVLGAGRSGRGHRRLGEAPGGHEGGDLAGGRGGWALEASPALREYGTKMTRDNNNYQQIKSIYSYSFQFTAKYETQSSLPKSISHKLNNCQSQRSTCIQNPFSSFSIIVL